jgi:hypothetical protein
VPPTPPHAVAVEVVATRPTDGDATTLARLSRAGDREIAPVAYLVKIHLEVVPPATSSGWALYVDDFRVPKYWEYRDGIYFKVYDPQFFVEHAGGALRFSADGTEFRETGLTLTGPDVTLAPSDDTGGLPLQDDVLS